MKTYKYNVNTIFNKVIVEIYYESKRNIPTLTGDKLQIWVCSKSFKGHIFKNYPNKKQLIAAKKWAVAQCEIMNKHQ